MATETIHEEHRRLERQIADLQREHDQLVDRPFNRDEHERHRARLQASLAELHMHATRLRRRET